MRFKKILLIIGITFQTLNCFGQYFQFSQFNYTQHRVNPATVSASDFARASLVYRQQRVSDDLNIKSTFLEGSYPLFNKRGRWSGIGISLLDDRAGYGGMFQTKEFGLSYSLSIPLKKYSSLNLGFRTVYQNKKISFDGLTTGYQYVPGHGMIGDNNGEDLDNFRTDFLTFTSGIYWQKTDRYNNKLAVAGVSLFDFNRPQERFYEGNNNLSSTLVINGGFQVFENNGFSVFPEFLYTHSGSKGLLNIGTVMTYDLYKSMYSKQPGKVNFITKYVTGQFIIAGIQFEKEKFALGFSYDIPVGKNVANQGTVEFGAEFRQLIKNSSKNKIKKSKAKKKKATKKKVVKKKKKSEKKKVTKKTKKSTKKRHLIKDNPEAKTPKEKNKVILPKEEKEIAVKDTSEIKEDKNVELIEEFITPEDTGKEVETSAKSGKVNHLPLELEEAILHFNFEFGKIQLNKESKMYLKELTNILLGDDLLKVTIIGHTDDVGSDDYNKRLSLERAQVVRDFLLSEGVSSDKIVLDGRGESEPLLKNDTPENRAKNRRVEFKISY